MRPPPQDDSHHTPIFQLRRERERLTVTGLWSGNGERCTSLQVVDVVGSSMLYPRGATQPGIRRTAQSTVKTLARTTLARTSLATIESAPGGEAP